MSSIYSLIPDIKHFIETNEDWYEQVSDLNKQQEKNRVRSTGHEPRRGLRLSGLGDRCPRALWYSIHHPELAERTAATDKFKFSYGHIIEQMALSLCRLAGHSVEGEQDELVVDGICGHRDAVVDGCILDVKSCSGAKFDQYRKGFLVEATDAFGYLYQLDGYVVGSAADPLVSVKDRGYLLFVDKEHGGMVLHEHYARPVLLRSRIEAFKAIIGNSSPPPCGCGLKPVGSSGNIGLDTRANYNPYKHLCFPELRTFQYKDGPDVKLIHLVKVVREPDVPEIFRLPNKEEG